MKTAAVTLVLVLLPTVCAAEWEENSKLAELFHQAGGDGTFVVHNPTLGKLIGFNQARASTRYVPASTFKIANTLIGLSTGAVTSVDQVLEYGGKPQPFPSWEHDMSMRNAIAISNVAIYQNLARRIGLARMQAGVVRLAYGNMQIGPIVDRFWLDGPLEISAVEQVAFLGKLADNALPLPEVHQVDTQKILYRAAGEGWMLWAKSGWQNAPGPGVGWWVGWVRSHGVNYPFALNIDITRPEMAGTRETLTMACLEALGLLD